MGSDKETGVNKHVFAGACCHVLRQGKQCQAQGTSLAAEPLEGLEETALDKQDLQVLPLPGFFFFLITLVLRNCKELWHQNLPQADTRDGGGD